MARVIGDFDGDFTGFQRGGDQTLENPTSDLGNQYYGDVTGTLFDFSRGGNDTIFATGRGADSFGDATTMRGFSRGGNDTIWHASVLGRAFGDAVGMFDFARGGNDVIRSVGEIVGMISMPAVICFIGTARRCHGG